MPVTPSYGQIYNDGVKYIKINRYDSGGLDRSNYLNQLQSITLTYPDRSAIEYPIVGIQEQDNFYLYGITPGYNTSSKGEILDYSLNVTQDNGVTASSGETRYITNYSTVTTNPINYFTASTGVYYFHKTPNVRVNYSWSTLLQISSGSAGPDSQLTLGLSGSKIGGIALADLGGFSSVLNTTISGSGTLFPNTVFGDIDGSPIENSYYQVSLFNDNEYGGGNMTIKGFNIQFITASAPFNGSSSLVILNPDTLNFIYNDYNPLLGNAETPQYSNTWMDIDYSQNPVVPTNFDLIIAGTADRAYVQDSNYSSKAWSNLRYNGSRTNSYIKIQ